jgi:endonuclease YncB( thermonuclease family)
MRFTVLTVSAALAMFMTVFFWPAEGGETPAIAGAARASTFPCTVIKVHDGDGPIWCDEREVDGKPIKIRLTAIAARELDETCSAGHPCPTASGASAQKALERLALGQVLQCEATGTSYGRTTAWCWRSDGVELNCAMVEGGWALRWDKFDPQRRMCR